MKRSKAKFALGKLKHDYLSRLLSNIEIHDSRVIMGSKIGEDAAIIDIPGDNYLVVKTDPITFATDKIGYYAVNVNVNDLVCSGAEPKWFQSTILLPEKNSSRELIESIFSDIQNTCDSMGITVVGGHTEITQGLERPIVIGSLIGEVKKSKLVLTSGAKPDDSIILTKGIFIEGTSIIGHKKEKELKKRGYDITFINKCKNYLYTPGISVYKEALLANQHFLINSMHDPTEGGILTGIAEMAIASENGVMIDIEKIKILQEPLELSKIFNLNPLNTISSGSLLIALNNEISHELVDLLNKNNANAEIIGKIIEKKKGLRMRDEKGNVKPLTYTEIDEITKIL